ncbi:hypothetical protein Celaphus_00011250, partial [Cervus elaphus hippelaphus]
MELCLRVDKATNQVITMKRIRLEKEEEGVPSPAIQEISLTKRTSSSKYNLKKYLDSIPPGEFTDSSLVQSYLYQILQGIVFCHSRRVLYKT